ncbi:hypothetical protein SCUCBS95973_009261 [Sporothrix curviconia]|uniref:Uncharacterized protein n=1 Tax=Sporothrix curviconia TaxID=1260050 RepID=A0ABP0CUC7_9PEZI
MKLVQVLFAVFAVQDVTNANQPGRGNNGGKQHSAGAPTAAPAPADVTTHDVNYDNTIVVTATDSFKLSARQFGGGRGNGGKHHRHKGKGKGFGGGPPQGAGGPGAGSPPTN